MFEMNSRPYRVLTTSLIYLVAIAGALTIATLRSRAKAKPADTEASYTPAERPPSTKPYFRFQLIALMGARDNARLWVDYQGVDHLDFRVYQVKDPQSFFTGLEDPHQTGKRGRAGSGQLPATPQVVSRKGARFQALGI